MTPVSGLFRRSLPKGQAAVRLRVSFGGVHDLNFGFRFAKLWGLRDPERRMNLGKALFAQVMEFVPWKSFGRIVARQRGDAGVRRRVVAFSRKPRSRPSRGPATAGAAAPLISRATISNSKRLASALPGAQRVMHRPPPLAAGRPVRPPRLAACRGSHATRFKSHADRRERRHA